MGVWVDTDMGVDDLFAVLALARLRRIDGLSLSFGNAPLAQVVANTGGAVAAFGWRFPAHSGADRAVLGAVETAQRVLGEAGMPTRGGALPAADPPHGAPAFDALATWLEARDGAEILALGPLTNLAVLALARPDLLQRIARVTWMGGAVGAGNHTASAEFNAYADPEAAAILLARGVPLRMVDLDICRAVQVHEADVTALRAAGGRRASLLADLLGGYLDIALHRGRTSMALYDPVAAAALAMPDAFHFARCRVEVALAGGLTRGRTVVDQRPTAEPNAEIAVSVDAAAVRMFCLDALREAAE